MNIFDSGLVILTYFWAIGPAQLYIQLRVIVYIDASDSCRRKA